MDSRRHGRRLVTASLAAVLCLGAVEVAAPSLAYASAPQCTTTTTIDGIDDAGDRTRLIVPAAGTNAGCWLAQGSNSAAVSALQRALNTCNSQTTAHGPRPNTYPLAIDGDYGGHTRDAVWNLQYFHQIGTDGVYGSVTRNNMEFLVAPGASDATCGSIPR